MNWHEYALSIPKMPTTEAAARIAYRSELARIERDVVSEDRAAAREALGDTWGESATFLRWTLAP